MSDTGEAIVVFCPECSAQYRLPASAAGKKARCKCGHEFQVAAPAPKPVAAVQPAPAAEFDPFAAAPPEYCVNHPQVPAVYGCARCHKFATVHTPDSNEGAGWRARWD